MLLSVFLGSGTQLLSMAGITLVFACLGFLSPANRSESKWISEDDWSLVNT